MREAVTFFRQALAEQGLDAEIAHESDDFKDTFYATKTIDGETVTLTTSVTFEHSDNIEKEIALAAQQIARRFKGRLTERFDWGSRHIELRPHDDPEALCNSCGTSVNLPEQASVFTRGAELSAPQPRPIKEETVLESLDDHSTVLLKMYLIGRLRDKCDASCPNSNKPKDLYRGSP